MVFRITAGSDVVNHECDCLVMSKTGYLTEIEIKRSYEDFLADFRKEHTHEDKRINHFCFLVHISFAEKVIDKLAELRMIPSEVMTYDDDAFVSDYRTGQDIASLIAKNENIDPYDVTGLKYYPRFGRRLFLEEQYQLARLGAMRYKNMTERIIKMGDQSGTLPI